MNPSAIAPVSTGVPNFGNAASFIRSIPWTIYLNSADKQRQTALDRLANTIHIREFNPKAAGADNTKALSDLVSALNRNPGYTGLLDPGTYLCSADLALTANGTKLIGAGISAIGSGIPVGGTIIRRYGNAGGAILTLSPPNAPGNYRLSDCAVKGITFDAGGLADRGFLIKSIWHSEFRVGAYGAFNVAGLELNCCDSISGTKDTQYNDVSYLGFIPSGSGNGLRCDGIESVANTSLNSFRHIDIYAFDGPAIWTATCDTNFWGMVRTFIGGASTYSADWQGGVTSVFEGTRAESYQYFGSNKAAVARNSGFMAPARAIRIKFLDRGNGTPDPVEEHPSQKQVYWEYPLTPFYDKTWKTWTPTVTASGGTFTALGTVIARYQLRGNAILFELKIPITTNGTANTEIVATLPFACPSGSHAAVPGWEESTKIGLIGRIYSAGTTVAIRAVDGTYPGADGRSISISGEYEFISSTLT